MNTTNKKMYPLTQAQQRIVYTELQYPDTTALTISGTIQLSNQIDLDRLEAAIHYVLQTNDSFNIRITEVDGIIKQYIAPYEYEKIQFIDFDSISNDLIYEQWLEENNQIPINLYDNKLIQITTFKINHKYGYNLKTHHAIADGISLGITINEITEQYNNLISGKNIDYITKQSYINYISLEEEYLKSLRFEKDKAYWNEKFKNSPNLVDIKVHNSKITSTVAKRKKVYIPYKQYKDIQEFCKQQKLSTFSFFLGVLYIYLNKITNENDLIVGTNYANRTSKEEKSTLGMFVSTVAFRNEIRDDQSFINLLRTLSQEQIKVLRHQKYPYNYLMQDFKAIHNTNEVSRLFGIALEYRPLQWTKMDGQVVKAEHEFCGHEINDVLLRIVEMIDEDNLELHIDYRTALFDETEIENMARDLLKISKYVITSPHMKILDLSLIDESEEKIFLEEFNNTITNYPKNKAVYQLFEEQVRLTPGHPAAMLGIQEWTYQQLNERSNQMAHMLKQQGIQPEQLVGILAKHSIELVVAMLAVHKAGGAYVPIDPEYPAERIQYMLDDSAARWVVTDEASVVPEGYSGHIVLLHNDSSYHERKDNLEPVSSPEGLAYVIYTSGSTGRPKGVLIEHQGLTNYICWAKDMYVQEEKTNFALYSSISFDLTVTSLFTPLVTGNTMIIYDEADKVALIPVMMKDPRVDLIKLTPAHLQIVKELDLGAQSMVRKLIVGGESLSSRLAQQITEQFQNKVTIYNEYGPTETVVGCTIHIYDSAEEKQEAVPIGRPAANTSIYILDDRLKLVPMGVAGELYIAGDGVARGYLNQPELTQERFVDHPFQVGEKMYKSGDLARWLPEGQLEYLGRADDQVKIRGYRIELGEVELRMLKVAEVQEAAVVVREQEGMKQLCAYYVAKSKLTIRQLREALAKELPEYMIPSYLVQLEQIPLTANGKIDRKGLPAPEEQLVTGTAYVAPRTEAERVLTEVWQKVLGIARVGIEDNFFELGGDSIKAIQVSSRLFQAGYKVEMKHLFAHPSIAALDLYMEKITRYAEQGMIQGEVTLTPIQHWLFARNVSDVHYFNQALTFYRTERFEESVLRPVMSKLVAHHDALRMVFRSSGETGHYEAWNQSIEESQLYHLERHDFQDMNDPAAALEAAATQIQSSMSLDSGPLVRLGWFQCADGDHLLIAIHHLVVDGVSWRILLEDFASAYEQAAAGQEIELPQKTDSFQLWAEQLSSYAKSETLQKEKAYWSEVESRATGMLPKEKEAGEHLLQDSEVLTVVWSEEETELLLKKTHGAYRTEINDLLLTALGMTIQEWTGMEAIRINLEGHGREPIGEDVDVSRTVGWFTSQFPVVLSLPAGETVGRRIKRVKEELRQIPNKGIGYGVLRYLGEVEDRGWKEHPEISFNYLGQFDQDLENSGLSSSVYSSGDSESQRHGRSYVLDINGMITDGCLTFGIGYSSKQYEAATMEQLGERLHGHLSNLIEHCVSQEKSELTPSDVTLQGIGMEELEQLVEQTADRGEIEDVYPLTPMQKGMLFHSLLDAESGAYFEQATLTIEGNINVPKLIESIELLSKRHAILRTNFYNEWRNKPLQIVYKDKGIEFNYQKTDELFRNEAEINLILQEYSEKDNQRGFDLYSDSLMRITLLQFDKDKYHMIWSFHHILMDGWCAPLLFNELFTNYYCLCQDKSIANVDVTPYSQYIEWLDNQDLNESSKYWKCYLDGYNETVSLSRPKESEQKRYDIDELVFELGIELTNKLKKIANQNQVTINTIIQSVWGILLQRYNNTKDAVFGTVVSGRPTDIHGIEQMIGLFINTIPVRIQNSKGDSFDSLVKKIQQQAIESNRYDTYPLYEIQKEKEQKQELIDHIMVFENYPMDTKQDENVPEKYLLKVKNADVKEQTNYNFNLIVAPGESYKIRLNYNKNAYDRKYIEQIKRHLHQILCQVLENSYTLLDDIEIVDYEEKAKLLEFSQDREFGFMENEDIITLFENRVRKFPDKVAVLFGEESLTYFRLNQYANKIANMLKTKGINSNEVVALMTDRSLDMIVGILGILKAGAAYLPIDPDFPNERIEFMLQDSNSKVVLLPAYFNTKIPTHIDHLCWYNEIGELTKNCDDKNLGLEITANQLAYIIYTSGTTGKPKGILTSHKNVVRVVKDTNYITINSSDIILQLSNYAFDGSIFDIFGALLNGAQLVMIKKENLLDVKKLADCIVKKKVTVLFITTALFNVLIDYGLDSLLNIRKVLFGGERASHLHIKKALNYLGPNKIIHVYGPTESTVFATYNEVNELNEEITNISIGKPLGYTKIYILNDSLQFQPVGIAGELCIGGAGLAKGYLNHPDLTNNKFIGDPVEYGEKIYKTGDLARWLPDGNIEYLGRIDHQVKIRGYRIELGEIEAQLLKIQGINESLVIVQEEQIGLKRLCAYWVGDPMLETNSIKKQLITSLPEYMIPSYFMRIDQFPLTPNGKINTKMLPSLSSEESQKHDFAAPKTEIEILLTETWENVLGINRVSINDNFFEIGGDSIKIIQITARLAQKGYNLDMKHWFKKQTIQELSKHIKQSVVVIEQKEVYGEVPLTPIQKWFVDQNYDEPHYFNQSMMLFSQEAYREKEIRTTMDHILNHHDYLRTILKKSSDGVIAYNRRINSENLYSLAIYDLINCNDLAHTVENLANKTQSVIDLEKGPLINIAVFKTLKGDHLLLSVHHFIIDMVSWRILLEDFSTVYKQLENRKEVKLPNKTSSYQDWAFSLLEYSKNEELMEEKKYWNEIFEESYTPIPKDFRENKGIVADSEALSVTLSSEDTEALLKNSHQAYNTEINDLLLVSIGMAINLWTQIENIVINLEGHGREQIFTHLNITRTVGWFTTQYPVVLNMKESRDLDKTIIQTRDMLRGIPNKGIGYGVLKYLSSKIDDFINHCAPEISFNYLGQFDQDLQSNSNYLSDYSKGSDVSLKQCRANVLDIYGIVIDGKLSFNINYSKHQYTKKTMFKLAGLLKNSIEKVINHCVKKNTEMINLSPYKATIFDNIENFSNQIFNEKYLLDIPGISMVIVKNGKFLLNKSYGYSNIPNQIPMSSTSLVRVGSITKLITASLILQLEEEKKLDLDVDIENYLGDLNIFRTNNSSLTIRHLLDYNSGFDIKNKGMDELFDFQAKLSLKEFIKSNMPSVILEPGQSYQYESFGFLLLGYLIEKIEGVSFEQYAKEKLLIPLEMYSSNMNSSSLSEKMLASGYDFNSEDVGMYNYSSLDSSSGGMISNGSDLAKFMMMLLQNGVYKGKQILNETVTKKMLTLNKEKEIRESYGHYGFEINFHPLYMDVPILSKSGNIHGYSSFMLLMPEENLGLLILCNKSVINKMEIFESFMNKYYPDYKNNSFI